MAAASDKARFYLEQYVPELQEYERKQIFTREEITAITAKRSDFEHIVNARGSKPSDYARYATYEMNLDSLRKKRCNRLGIKGTKGFSGQRTVFFILDRATKKFPGDLGLWMQYIDYCRRQKANKKLAKVFTGVLRLRPRDWGLWVLAAKYYAEEQGDMATARSYMQRGLRFCMDKKALWLEYAKLEMVYLAKLAARRKILGLDEQRVEKDQEAEDENMISLPVVTAEDINPEASGDVNDVDADALQRIANAPAFTGAIPTAILDAALKQFNDNPEIAEDFFELVASFDNVPCTRHILQHILDHLHAVALTAPETMICEARLHLLGVDAASADFPAALGAFLADVKSGMSEMSERKRPVLAEKAVLSLLPYLDRAEELDEDLQTVLVASINRFLRSVSAVTARRNEVKALAEAVKSGGRLTGAEILRALGKDMV